MKPLIVTTALLLAVVVADGLINGFTLITATGVALTATGLTVALQRGAWQ